MLFVLISTAWVLLSIHTEYTLGQTTWNMHDACGTVISKADLAGELHFDAEQLPVNLPGHSCKVTITPLKLDNKDGMVLFYFTTFRFEDSCEKMNVTVIDGDSNYDNVVNDLPRYLCGVNTLLERKGQFFSSSGRSLKVIYNADESGVNKPGTFIMKFVSYHTGSCYGSDVHECSNGHCVSKEYACSSDFDVCGDTDSNCGVAETSEAVASESVAATIFSVIAVIIFVLFTVFGFCMVHRNGRGGSGCGCLREICECVCECAGRCCEGIADICANCCRCTREKCSSCGESIGTFKTSCGDHCAECCQSIRNKCSGCALFREMNNHDTNNRSASNPSGSPGDANIMTSQPTSVQGDSLPAVMASDTSSTSSNSDWESENDVASNNHATPSAPPMQNLSVEDPPPSYDEAVAPSYKDYVANKERYAKHKHKRKK
ncbi:uncharacterized protein LOC123559004 [Mercenaria mercenaria]|uniref:uncharacterized protein LOC123559004 n=1 Tax=Mercenaria mercenaria TaxID=6596 RepID=UPI00234E98E1|nr:uncharacterized protein LOC123559004 [Mercenaria mercenaria]